MRCGSRFYELERELHTSYRQKLCKKCITLCGESGYQSIGWQGAQVFEALAWSRSGQRGTGRQG